MIIYLISLAGVMVRDFGRAQSNAWLQNIFVFSLSKEATKMVKQGLYIKRHLQRYAIDTPILILLSLEK